MKRGFSQYLLLLGICACLLLSACGKKVLIGTPPQTAFPPAAASETQAFSSMPPGLDSQTTGSLSDEEQRMVIDHTHQIHSKQEMQAFVDHLANHSAQG